MIESTGIESVWYNSFLKKYNGVVDETVETPKKLETESVSIGNNHKDETSKSIDEYTKLKNNHRKKVASSLLNELVDSNQNKS